MSSLTRRHGAHAPSRPAGWAEPLPQHGIENLHRISPLVLRSAQPRREAAPVLRELGVRTIVSLRAFNADDDVFRDGGIRLVRVPINTWHIRDRHVIRALAEVRIAERHGAVLIHCMHGADRTGIVSALYRMAVQGWDKESARLEMLQGGFGYHTMWRNIPAYLAQVDAAAIAHALSVRAPLTAAQS